MFSMLLAISTQIMVMAIVIFVVLLFIGVGVLILIHVCIVGRAFRDAHGTAARGEWHGDMNRKFCLEDLQRLPCYDFNGSEKGSSPIECAVCLEYLQMGDKCRLLPLCKHSFHAVCVDSWLLKSPICPICRTRADLQRSAMAQVEKPSSFGIGVGSRELATR